MATVRKDPDSGIWWLWWKVKCQDGKWRARSKSLETPDKITADEACAAYNKDQARVKRGLEPLYTEAARQSDWWGRFKKKALEHAESLAGLSEKKVKFLLGVMEDLFHPEKMTLTEFKEASIGTKYVTKRLAGEPKTRWCGTDTLVNRPVMASTIKTEISYLSPLFEKAIDEWEEIGITKNPFKKVSVGNRDGVRQKKDDPKYLPFAKVQAFFAECWRRHGPAFEFMAQFFYYIGPRLNEARHVRLPQDVDLEAGTVRLRGTKTDSAERIVPIPEAFMPQMRQAAATARPGFLFALPSGAMFPYSTIQQRFKRAFRSIGEPWAHAHTLRHCYTSHRLENGDNMLAVRDDVGHKNISTTNIYARRGGKKGQVNLQAPSQQAEANQAA